MTIQTYFPPQMRENVYSYSSFSSLNFTLAHVQDPKYKEYKVLTEFNA